MNLPMCPKCNKFPLLPLSDFGGGTVEVPAGSAAVLFKAWTCASSSCGYSVRIDKGKIAYEIVKDVRK